MMERPLRFIAATLALAFTATGCMVHSRAPVGTTGQAKSRIVQNDSGVQVVLRADGKALLYNRPHSRERLVKRLIEEEGGNRGSRAILLEAGPGVGLGELREMRDYLVKHRIPRIVLVSQPIVTSESMDDRTRPLR